MENPKILLIHGFGGGVHEVQPLADFLVSRGFPVCCPVLKGHAPLGGTIDRRTLSRARWTDWLEDASRELASMEGEVVIIGFSMGGLIALQLAARYQIRSVITINTPISYWNLLQVAKNLADDLVNLRLDHTRRYLRAKGNSPLPSMLQFLKLLYSTKRLLSRVRCPVSLFQTKDDDTVRQTSVGYLLTHLGTEKKKAQFIEKGGHLVLHSAQAKEVVEAILSELDAQGQVCQGPEPRR